MLGQNLRTHHKNQLAMNERKWLQVYKLALNQGVHAIRVIITDKINTPSACSWCVK